MTLPPSIPSSLPQRPSLSFEQLREEGFALAQQLAGTQWTDYNDHDPGVTILEQLCYALTDLGYRTGYPIADLLAPPPGQAPPPDTLFTGDRLLVASPLTHADYRKVLYDQVKGVKNVWLRRSADSPHDGVYDILVDIFDDYNSLDQRQRILRDIWGLYHTYRNLTEDIHAVTILEPIYIQVRATVEIDVQPSPETILADLLYRLHYALAPFPELLQIDELFQRGVPPDEIFDGPPLYTGLIDDRSLTPLPERVRLNHLLRVIRQVGGVQAILPDASLYYGSRSTNGKIRFEEAKDGLLEIEEPRALRLYPNIFEEPSASQPGSDDSPGAEYPIRLLRDGHDYRPRSRKVLRKVREAHQELLKQYIYARRTMAEDAYRVRPEGTYRDPAAYFSIQHQFPLTYGIGPYGLPDQPLYPDPSGAYQAGFSVLAATPKTRKAQARQLKAYLLFFEQMLADYLAQLSHTNDLFSLRRDLGRSYFVQPLHSVPDREAVLPDRSTRRVLQEGLMLRLKPHVDAQGEPVLHSVSVAKRHLGDTSSFAKAPQGNQREAHVLERVTILADGEPGGVPVRGVLRGIRDTAESYGQEMMLHMGGTKIREAGLYIATSATEVVYSYQGARAHGVLATPTEEAPGTYVRVEESLGAEEQLVARRIIVLDAEERTTEPAITTLDDGAFTVGTGPGGALPYRYAVDAETEVAYSYKRELDAITTQTDTFLERRNTMLDHLLARFNEAFDDYALDRLDWRPAGDKDAFHYERLGWKEAFLEDYVAHSRDRGQGYNYFLPYGFHLFDLTTNEVILRHYDLDDLKTRDRSIDEILNKYGAQPQQYALIPFASGSKLLALKNPEGDILAYAVDTFYGETHPNEAIERISETIKQGQVRVQRFPDPRWPLLSGLELRARLLLGIGETQPKRLAPPEANAKEAAPDADEGFYVVEHILLRPLDATADDDEKHQLTTRLLAGENEFATEEAARRGIADLAATIERLAADEAQCRHYLRRFGPSRRARRGSYQESVAYQAPPGRGEASDPARPFGLFLIDAAGIVRLSVYDLSTEEAREQRLADVLRYGRDPANYRLHEIAYGQFRIDLYKSRAFEAGDDFYPYRLSVFFPAWPDRFQKQAFRQFAREVVRENCPAHVGVDIYWLDRQDMAYFEAQYFAWVEAKARFQYEDWPQRSTADASHQQWHDAHHGTFHGEAEVLTAEDLGAYFEAARQHLDSLLLLAKTAYDLREVTAFIDDPLAPLVATARRIEQLRQKWSGDTPGRPDAWQPDYFRAWAEAERARALALIVATMSAERLAALDQAWLDVYLTRFEEEAQALSEALQGARLQWAYVEDIAQIIERHRALIAAFDAKTRGVLAQRPGQQMATIEEPAAALRWFILDQEEQQHPATGQEAA